jgi:hypothetical protein
METLMKVEESACEHFGNIVEDQLNFSSRTPLDHQSQRADTSTSVVALRRT